VVTWHVKMYIYAYSIQAVRRRQLSTLTHLCYTVQTTVEKPILIAIQKNTKDSIIKVI
jgi:hypothetical protein